MPATICQTIATDASCSGLLHLLSATRSVAAPAAEYFSFSSALFVPSFVRGLLFC